MVKLRKYSKFDVYTTKYFLYNYNENMSKLVKLKFCRNKGFESIKINKKLDYWLYCDKKGRYYTASNILDVPRSIFMNLIAKQIKRDFKFLKIKLIFIEENTNLCYKIK